MANCVPFVVSLLALAFTLLSFWWMHWREGNLSVGNLQHFAAGSAITGAADNPNTFLVGLPLIIFNTGARPVIIESLRLVSPLNVLGPLLYQAVETPLWTAQDPNKIERNSFFLPVIVRANEVIKENFVSSQAALPP